MRLLISKIALAFFFALCLALPFASSVASAGAMSTHTHICHDEAHEDDCDGTNGCCKICRNINMKLCYAAKILATPEPAWLFSSVNFESSHTTHINLISLKVRLNN